MLRAAGHHAIHASGLGVLGLPTASDGRGPAQLRRSADEAAKTRKALQRKRFSGSQLCTPGGTPCCESNVVISLDELGYDEVDTLARDRRG